MGSPLTPRAGYVVTLSQVTAAKPRAVVSCSGCHYVYELPSVDVEASDDAAFGAIVREALTCWETHRCEDAYVMQGAGHGG